MLEGRQSGRSIKTKARIKITVKMLVIAWNITVKIQLCINIYIY
jgi:hypothetical protein